MAQALQLESPSMIAARTCLTKCGASSRYIAAPVSLRGRLLQCVSDSATAPTTGSVKAFTALFCSCAVPYHAFVEQEHGIRQ